MNGPAMFGAPRRRPEIMYARVYHFEKKNSKTFSPEGPRENVWGPRENVSLGSAVALAGPVPRYDIDMGRIWLCYWGCQVLHCP